LEKIKVGALVKITTATDWFGICIVLEIHEKSGAAWMKHPTAKIWTKHGIRHKIVQDLELVR